MAARVIWAHRLLALMLGLFITAHLLGHLAALHSIAAQDAVLETLRRVYRAPWVEPFLLSGFAVQIAIGLRLVWRRMAEKQKSIWSWLQILSGLYLALFVVLHASAAVWARWQYDLDTDFYWPAGTLVLSPLKYGFAPYYFFGIVSVFIHLAAALHFAGVVRWPKILIGAGVLLAIALLAAFSGQLYSIELPESHKDYYRSHPGVDP